MLLFVMGDNYDGSFFCTYKQLDDDDLYRIQFLQAFIMNELNDSELREKVDKLYGIFFKKKKSEIHVGNIKLGSIDWNHKTANVSYMIGEKIFQRKGIASYSLKKITKIAKKKFS